jgi:hypothetical protein
VTKRSNGAAKAAPKRKPGRSLTEAERTTLGYGTIKLRLPLDALAQLAELSDEGDASRAEIVDSLIRIEWAGTPGRKLRSKRDELAADIARG